MESASGESDANNPYTPYWERSRSRPGQSRWGNIPVPLRPRFLRSMLPMAALHRSCPFNAGTAENATALKRRFRDALDEALINAALREPLPEEGEKAEQPGVEEAAPLELGWLVHDSANTTDLVALTYVLSDFNCEIDPLAEASNLTKEHGNVGASRDALMLAEALLRAKQLQKPVLIAGFGEDDGIGVSLARPLARIRNFSQA
jgi:hypothetical protein